MTVLKYAKINTHPANRTIHDYIATGGLRQLSQIKWFLFNLKNPDFSHKHPEAWKITRLGNLQAALNFIKMGGVRLPLISIAAMESGEKTVWDHAYSNTSVANHLMQFADDGYITEGWIDENLHLLLPTIQVTRHENAMLGEWVKRQYCGDFSRIQNMEHYKYNNIQLLRMTDKQIGRKLMYAEHITSPMQDLIIVRPQSFCL